MIYYVTVIIKLIVAFFISLQFVIKFSFFPLLLVLSSLSDSFYHFPEYSIDPCSTA